MLIKQRVMHLKYLSGFSLIELMVAMVVGLVIIAGALSLHVATRKIQTTNEAQMDMVADARFAIQMLSYDLRSAGLWGGNNNASIINCKATDAVCSASSSNDTPPTVAAVSGDCATGWYYDLNRAVFATNNTNPYASSCIPATEHYLSSTDVLEIRYADANQPTALKVGQVYMRSNYINGRIFIGATAPKLAKDDSTTLTNNYILHDYAYYISDYSDAVGDGIPSLRRVSLVNGPALQNQLVISGVANLQVQFGEDLDGNQTIDRYESPQNVADWNNIHAVKIWLVLRSDKKQKGVNTQKTFSIAGNNVSYGGQNGYRYFMVSSVVALRNLM